MFSLRAARQVALGRPQEAHAVTAPDEQAWFNGDHSAGTGSGRAWAKPAAGRSRRTSATLLCLSRADARIQAQEHADWPVGHAVAKRLGDDALATLRESLSNVVRNAEADAGEVCYLGWT